MLPREADGLRAREVCRASSKEVCDLPAHGVQKFTLRLHARLLNRGDWARILSHDRNRFSIEDWKVASPL
jgi:hypothetical protein